MDLLEGIRDKEVEESKYDSTETKSIGIGMDCAVLPLKQGYFLIQTTDFFYPIVDDPFTMGRITCANVLSDLFSMGVVICDNIYMLLGVPSDMPVQEQEIVLPAIIDGFKNAAKEANVKVTAVKIQENPWCMIGGTATAVCTRDEFIMPENACAGDVLVLTKPLGTQVAALAYAKITESSATITLPKDIVMDAFHECTLSMARLNYNAAILMHKYKGNSCTDVTGFGILGHAENLAQNQTNAVDFVLEKLPLFKNVRTLAETLGHDRLLRGRSAETSGGLLISMPPENAQSFCNEIEALDGRQAWIIGQVVTGSRKARMSEHLEIIEV